MAKGIAGVAARFSGLVSFGLVELTERMARGIAGVAARFSGLVSFSQRL
jgi:hypothetical protein